MHLLTVTCWKDKEQFLLQCISIKKYLSGQYRHYIVINDFPNDLSPKVKKIWQRLVYSAYGDGSNNWEIIFPEWNDQWGKCDYNWRSQQIFKFFYYEIIKDDYIILDSKNFFVRPTDIESFNGMIGAGLAGMFIENFDSINRVYAEYFGCEPLKNALTPWTPFVVEYDVLKKYADPITISKTLYSLRTEVGPWPCEFIFYSYLIKEKLQDVKLLVDHIPIFGYAHRTHGLELVKNNENYKLLGLHRNAVKKMTIKQSRELNLFLEYFDLPNVLESLLILKNKILYKHKNQYIML